MGVRGKHNGSLDEKEREYKRVWYLKNKDKVREQVKKNREIRKSQGIEWSQINKERIRKYNYQHKLKINYGLTVSEYDLLAQVQNNVCAICGKEQMNKKFKNLSVDHDHKTGKVRGLLCNRCNTALGNLKEDVSIMENMIKYISKFK